MAGNEEKIRGEVVGILTDMTSDWDVDFGGGLTEKTQLVADLSFESVEIVQLMIAIEQHFKLKKLATSRLLMKEGRYVDDVSVGQIVGFLAAEMNGAT